MSVPSLWSLGVMCWTIEDSLALIYGEESETDPDETLKQSKFVRKGVKSSTPTGRSPISHRSALLPCVAVQRSGGFLETMTETNSNPHAPRL